MDDKKKEFITHCVIDEELGVKYAHDQDALFICAETKESICLHCLESIYEDNYSFQCINNMPVYTKVCDGFHRMVSVPQRAEDLKESNKNG